MKAIVEVKGATINVNELWFLNEIAKMINQMSEREIERFTIGNVNSTLLKSMARSILSDNERLKHFVDADDYFADVVDVVPEEEEIL